MKRIISLLLTVVLAALLLGGCGAEGGTKHLAEDEAVAAEASGLEFHKIGVSVYNVADSEVRMFKDYLDNYIKACFSSVTFIYSDSISNGDELMEFYAHCAEEGCDGVFAFLSYDLKREVEFCAEKKMYYIRPNGTTSDEQFDSVADNPYYVGEIGPGKQLEMQAAEDMTRALAAKDSGQNYIILSGGAAFGNEMHRLRTVAILETLEGIYGGSLGTSAEDLAQHKDVTSLEIGGAKVALIPGFLRNAETAALATGMIRSGAYNVLLSTLPVSPVYDAINAVDIKCGVIDCFSEDNMLAFNNGKLAYVAGKYQSEIGPGFAALLNAIMGDGEILRDGGKAFRLSQGFWNAASREEYDAMYGLASGAAVNAYNNEDLYSMLKSVNDDLTFDYFKKMTESWTYEECAARRETGQ